MRQDRRLSKRHSGTLLNSQGPSSATRNLANYLEQSLLDAVFPAPAPGEKEPQYTARVVLPKVAQLITSRVQSPQVWIRGDGAGLKAYSRMFLGFMFHPDIAVGENGVNHWCAEVKLTKDGFNGDVVAKALGQALLYHDVFPVVTIIMLDQTRAPHSQNKMIAFTDWLNVLVISRFE